MVTRLEVAGQVKYSPETEKSAEDVTHDVRTLHST